MANNLISVVGNEIYAGGITVTAIPDGADNTRLVIEFVVHTEPTHEDAEDEYSDSEKTRKREFTTGRELRLDDYKVTTEDRGGGNLTKVIIQAKVDTKVPGTGGVGKSK